MLNKPRDALSAAIVDIQQTGSPSVNAELTLRAGNARNILFITKKL